MFVFVVLLQIKIDGKPLSYCERKVNSLGSFLNLCFIK